MLCKPIEAYVISGDLWLSTSQLSVSGNTSKEHSHLKGYLTAPKPCDISTEIKRFLLVSQEINKPRGA
jgi:hypothetical protein